MFIGSYLVMVNSGKFTRHIQQMIVKKKGFGPPSSADSAVKESQAISIYLYVFLSTQSITALILLMEA
jgi:hypothetical protein